MAIFLPSLYLPYLITEQLQKDVMNNSYLSVRLYFAIQKTNTAIVFFFFFIVSYCHNHYTLMVKYHIYCICYM